MSLKTATRKNLLVNNMRPRPTKTCKEKKEEEEEEEEEVEECNII
jgi:hypothetical protein